MYCKKCGNDCQPEHRFCGKCGHPLSFYSAILGRRNKIVDKSKRLMGLDNDSYAGMTFMQRFAADGNFRRAIGVFAALTICAGALTFYEVKSYHKKTEYHSIYPGKAGSTTKPQKGKWFMEMTPAEQEAAAKESVERALREFYDVKRKCGRSNDMYYINMRVSAHQQVQGAYMSLINCTQDPVRKQLYREQLNDFIQSESR